MKYRIHPRYLAVAVALSVAVAGVTLASVRAQEPNQVGLVVDFGNGAVTTRCVEFAEQEISGYEVLRRSGLPIVANEVSGMGVTICDIGGISGCLASSCFCKCQGMTCMYWTYHRLEGGAWQYSPLGASAHTVRHGDVEGWAWGEGTPGGGVQPPLLSFDQICPASDASPGTGPAASATNTPLPTATALAPTTPPPSPSSSITAAATPTATSSPTIQPTAASSPSVTPRATPSLSPTSTSPRATVTTPAATPAEAGQVETADESRPESRQPAGLSRPMGYVVFGVIVVGLLGWYILVTRVRR